MRSRQYLARQAGATIGRFRRQRDLSQPMLANMAHMTKGMLSLYETGQQCPSLFSLVKILAALGISWQQFGQALVEAGEGPRAA